MNVESEKTREQRLAKQKQTCGHRDPAGAARGQRAGGQVGEVSETKRSRLPASQ